MASKTKSYTKEEFERLLKTDATIGYYTTKDTGEYFERYICSDKKMTDEECDMLDNYKLGTFEVMNIDKLGEIESEAYDRIWFDRSPVGTNLEPKDMPADIKEKILDQQKRVIEEYNINPEECDDFYHGYWSGILAMCRYLNSGRQVDLEDLRTGDGLLDS